MTEHVDWTSDEVQRRILAEANRLCTCADCGKLNCTCVDDDTELTPEQCELLDREFAFLDQ